MKKRIGSKLYDTDTTPHIAVNNNGDVLYQKQTREREVFIVRGDEIIPLTLAEAFDLFPGAVIAAQPTGTSGYQVRVDKDTHAKLREMADERKTTISNIVKELVSKEKQSYS